jgi:hypothetical protein
MLAATWLLLLTGYEVLGDGFVPLSGAFLAIFASFFVTFAAFHWLGREAARALPSLTFPQLIHPDAVIALGILASVATIAMALGAARSAEILTVMDFRDLFSDAEGVPASVGVGVAFPLACCSWHVARKHQRSRLAWLLGLLVLTVAITSTSKIFLLLFFLFLLPWGEGAGRLRRWGIVGGLCAICAFGLSHVLLEKFSSSPEERLIGALADTLKVYVFGGIAGFQRVLAGAASFPEGAMWKPVGDLFPGTIQVPRSAILPWTTIGNWETNVYSAFAYWYDAFDAAAGVVAGSALGVLYGIMFGREGPGLASGFIRIYLLFPLLFMFHQDFFLPSMLGHIGFLGAAVLLALTRPELPIVTVPDPLTPEGPLAPTCVESESS